MLVFDAKETKIFFLDFSNAFEDGNSTWSKDGNEVIVMPRLPESIKTNMDKNLVKECAKKILELPNETVSRIVLSIKDPFMPAEMCERIAKRLIMRKSRVLETFEQWCV